LSWKSPKENLDLDKLSLEREIVCDPCSVYSPAAGERQSGDSIDSDALPEPTCGDAGIFICSLAIVIYLLSNEQAPRVAATIWGICRLAEEIIIRLIDLWL